jgi:hypothetical protein
MDEIETSEEGNNFVSKPFRAGRKALSDVGATRTLSGLRFPAGKTCE